MTVQQERTPKAADLVAAELRRRIVTGELPEGHLLPAEANLIEEFGVSRPSLREAYRILESESLLQVLRGAKGGARVQVPDGEHVARYAEYVLEFRGTKMADVYAARAELEAPLARLLTELAKPRHIKLLEQSLAAAEPFLEDPAAYAAHDVAFHQLVAELAGNKTLRLLVDVLYNIVATARHRHAAVRTPDLVVETKQVHRTHAQLVELIAEGDPVAAEDFWRLHLDEVKKHYLRRPLAKTVVEMMTFS